MSSHYSPRTPAEPGLQPRPRSGISRQREPQPAPQPQLIETRAALHDKVSEGLDIRSTVSSLELAERKPAVLAGVALALVLVATFGAAATVLAPTPRPSTPARTPGLAAQAQPSATSSAGPSTPAASPTATPTIPGAAPRSAHGFKVRKTVVLMRFPLRPTVRYTYLDNYMARRVGTPLSYNNAWVANGSTVLNRAHDGVDIDVPTGTPVLAPFDGVVIDPAKRWRPWRSDRYGIAAAIESDEPTSSGYVAIVAHLSTLRVKLGDHVRRGDVVGLTGRTGNAELTVPHLHFELRAPFRLRVRVGTGIRVLDAFDPFPSLAASDPRKRAGTPKP